MSSLSDKKFLYVSDKQDLVGLLENLIELNVNKVSIVSLSEIELEVPTSVAGVRVEQIEPFVYDLKNPN